MPQLSLQSPRTVPFAGICKSIVFLWDFDVANLLELVADSTSRAVATVAATGGFALLLVTNYRGDGQHNDQDEYQ